MRWQRLQHKSVSLGLKLALGLIVATAQCAAFAAGDRGPSGMGIEPYADYEMVDSDALRAVEAATYTEDVVSFAEVEMAADAPRAGATVTSVTDVGGGRYTMSGVALDNSGNPACALALASGRCMFTCGSGSLRCEGGTADLPFGHFELFNLPTEADGTLALQVFVQGHVSHTGQIFPDGGPVFPSRWGALSKLCCPSSSATLSVTIDGTTKRSVIGSCDSGSSASWEGWASTTPGAKAVTGTQTAATCPALTFNFTSQEFLPDRCYLFTSELKDGDTVMVESEVDCEFVP